MRTGRKRPKANGNLSVCTGMDETGTYLQTKDAEQTGYDCLVWSNVRTALSSQ